MTAIGKSFGLTELEDLGGALSRDTNNMNIEKIHHHLDQFENLGISIIERLEIRNET
jgi:hypothetical protein